MLSMKSFLVAAAAFGSATIVCPLCETVVARAATESVALASQLPDTATVRMRISGMTCATCPITARVALKKLRGVYDARVTYSDSLAVVRYDPRRVTPAQMLAHLTELTGYKGRVLPDSVRPLRGTAQ